MEQDNKSEEKGLNGTVYFATSILIILVWTLCVHFGILDFVIELLGGKGG